MIKDSLKKWVTEKHAKITAERDYETEKEHAIALLHKEKMELENALTSFNLHNHTIDYEGIRYVSFDGNIAHVSTKGERYTIRLQEDEDMLTFIKNLGVNHAKHTIVGRERWLMTTTLAPKVEHHHLPNLDFLTLNESEARITLDLKKEIDVKFIRGLLETINGNFSVSLNLEKVNKALTQLVRELNHWVPFNFTIKVDAVDVRAFTFYAENKYGDTYKFSNAGPYNVEALLFDPRNVTDNIKRGLTKDVKVANSSLEKMHIERERAALVKYAKEQLDSLGLKHANVELKFDETQPTIVFGRLKDPIVIYAGASKEHFDIIGRIELFKSSLGIVDSTTRTFVNQMVVVEQAEKPYSLEENFLSTSMTNEQMKKLLEDAQESWFEVRTAQLHKLFEFETPAVKEVLYRLQWDTTQGFSSYSLKSGTLNLFIGVDEYRELTTKIRNILRGIANLEFSESYKPFNDTFDPFLFGIEINKTQWHTDMGRILVVYVQNRNGESYTRYFIGEKAVPTDLIAKLKKA